MLRRDAEYEEEHTDNTVASDPFTIDTSISDVIKDPVFGDYGRLIFPVDDWYYSGDTLGDLRLTYYSNIDPDETVEIVNYIKEHAVELEVNTDGYSLWGGSAGARMAAWFGSYGTAAFGADDLPQPAAVIMQYTGLSEYGEGAPATFVTVGENDGIASWRVMKQRLDGMSALGIDTEFHSYPGLSHGFGLGTGTAAEGWIDEASVT